MGLYPDHALCDPLRGSAAGKAGCIHGDLQLFHRPPAIGHRDNHGRIDAELLPGEPIWTMLIAAIVMMSAAIAMLRVQPLGPNEE